MTWGRCTKKENANTTTLYLSVFDWPKDSKLTIPGLKNEIISVTILAGNKKLESISTSDGIVINVPDRAPGEIASVIKLEVKG
ncbi:MAG: alpha-L-fucosidase C-terminal domain-containing protein [Ginsengibacter sp.]